MALDPRKRQKKLERRAVKEKARKKALAKLNPSGAVFRLERSAGAPLLHTCGTRTLWDGMGYVLVSRELPSGAVAFAAFLVDMYCLGVKNAMYNVLSRTEYDQNIHSRLFFAGVRIPLRPECARKLVEGAVEYARELGFAPHSDYRQARLLFGDIDAAACSQKFEYGRDGKPLFIAGPHDSPARCRQIAQLLVARHGPDGAHYVIPLSRDALGDVLFLGGDGDYEDEEYDDEEDDE
jgi:hypothetical protein